MATNLSEFIALIKKNSIARINRFRIQFTLPETLDPSDIGDDVEKTISLTCLMADIPGRQEQTSTVSYGNYGRKVVYGRSTGDFNTTFLVTGKYVERKLFDAWHSVICDETQTAVEYYDSYVVNIQVDCLNEQDQVVYGFELSEAYPAAVSSTRMDRTAQNQQMVMDVNWAYHRITFLPDRNTNPAPVSNQPQATKTKEGSGKQRLLPIPEIDSFSNAVQTAMDNVSEFRGQLQGVLRVSRDVREQVRDAKMTVVDGVKTLNGVIKDVKAINNIPNDVKNEVVEAVKGFKNQLGYLNTDLTNIRSYPKR